MGAFGIGVDPRAVCIYPDGVSKHDAIDALIDRLSESGAVNDREEFRRAVHEREAVMSTGIGSGVAIPHVRIDAVTQPRMGVGLSRKGIAFNTLDDEPVHVVVLFAMPRGSQKDYLSLLAKVMLALKTPGFSDKLLNCKSPDEVAEILNA